MKSTSSIKTWLGASALLALVMIATVAHSGLFDFLGDAAPDEDVASAAKDNNRFAFDLYAKLRAADGDVVFSPYSISTALAMTYAGARGETAEQMESVMHYSLGQEKLHHALGTMVDDLNDRGGRGKYELVVANRLWGERTRTFLPEFLELNKKFYGAGFELVDFKTDPEGARKKINDWCEQKTRDKIKAPVPKGVIKPITRLALANAIYFKGMWASQFDQADTKDREFHLDAANKASVPMMWQKEEFGYWSGDGYSALELAYVGEDLSMVLLLPDEIDGLAQLEETVTAAKFNLLTQMLSKTKVDVLLPRFKIEFGQELSAALKQMGMTDAFDNSADFSGMDGTTALLIGAVIHQAMIDVNEEGTEAAAVTVVVMDLKTSMPRQIQFHADHPFMFFIRDQATGSVLFMGRVMDPR